MSLFPISMMDTIIKSFMLVEIMLLGHKCHVKWCSVMEKWWKRHVIKPVMSVERQIFIKTMLTQICVNRSHNVNWGLGAYSRQSGTCLFLTTKNWQYFLFIDIINKNFVQLTEDFCTYDHVCIPWSQIKSRDESCPDRFCSLLRPLCSGCWE
jgi:hypothetical protein